MIGNADHALAIANLKARYCAAADVSATDQETARSQFADIFAEGFVGDYGMGLLDGGQAITDFLCNAIGGSSLWMIHMLHSPRIEIEGDRATGDWTVAGQMKRRATGTIDNIIGRYRDEFCLTAGGWRIARITFTRLE